jgi:hypothetical protein
MDSRLRGNDKFVVGSFDIGEAKKNRPCKNLWSPSFLQADFCMM